MSNFLAIATVTATLKQSLTEAVGDVGGATVTTVRPESHEHGLPSVGVNIFLYQVNHNAAWRNSDLPARDSDGLLLNRPQVALDLHYLLTFYGNEARFEPQRLLGLATRTLHARAVLTRKMIRDAIATVIADHNYSFLADSNLADAVELVKFTPLPLSLEELSKLWSVFFQTPYTLSIAYQGTLVLIESEDTPHPSLQVRSRNLYTVQLRQPIIERVSDASGEDLPIVVGGTLAIHGGQLRGDVTLLRLGGVEVEPQTLRDSEITLNLNSPPLPQDTLRAGVQGVQVVHRLPMGTPPLPHRAIESNVAAFVLRPTVVRADVSNISGNGGLRSAEVTVEVNPTVRKGQRVRLMLNSVPNGGTTAYSFDAAPLSADDDSVSVHASDVVPGDYLVRIQIDGAESVLVLDTEESSETFNQFVEPRVEIR